MFTHQHSAHILSFYLVFGGKFWACWLLMPASAQAASGIVEAMRSRVIVHKLTKNLLQHLPVQVSSGCERGDKCARVKRKFEAYFIEADAVHVKAEKLEKSLSDVLSCKAVQLKRAKCEYDTAKREHDTAKREHTAAFKKAGTAKIQLERKAKALKGIDDVLSVLSGSVPSEFKSPIKAISAASSEWDLQQTCEFVVHIHQWHSEGNVNLVSELLVKKITNGCKAIGCRIRTSCDRKCCHSSLHLLLELFKSCNDSSMGGPVISAIVGVMQKVYCNATSRDHLHELFEKAYETCCDVASGEKMCSQSVLYIEELVNLSKHTIQQMGTLSASMVEIAEEQKIQKYK